MNYMRWRPTTHCVNQPSSWKTHTVPAKLTQTLLTVVILPCLSQPPNECCFCLVFLIYSLDFLFFGQSLHHQILARTSCRNLKKNSEGRVHTLVQDVPVDILLLVHFTHSRCGTTTVIQTTPKGYPCICCSWNSKASLSCSFWHSSTATLI